MTTHDIIWKLSRELDAGITSEIQVVYLLAGIRKLMERDGVKEQYPNLNFHCDWTLHSKLEGKAAKDVLRKFDAAHALLRDKKIELHDLPKGLRSEIERISQMQSFEKEMSSFLRAYRLPPLTKTRPDGWPYFLHLYGKVIEDIPLVVTDTTPKGPTHISHVEVHLYEKDIDHGTGRRDMLFTVTWKIHDKNGQSGEIYIINSFSLDAEAGAPEV